MLPLGYVIWSTSSLGASEAIDFLWRPRIGELLGNTVGLLLVGVLASVALGVLTAWLIERTDLPRRAWWHALMCAPLAIPAFVNGYAWVATTHAVQSFAGAVWVVTLSYYPLVYLPTVAALRGLDPSLEEVGASLGRTPWTVFRRVTLPAILPAVLGGALLVGLHLLAEYGALQLLNYPTLTTAILQQYGTSFNGSAATLLASLLVTLCLTLLLIEMLLRGRRRVARVGKGAVRQHTRHRLGRRAPLAIAGLIVLCIASIGVPMASVTRWLMRGTSAGVDWSELSTAFSSTFGLALASGALTTIAAVPVVWLAVRHRSRLTTAIERSTYTASAMPGIVVALAFVVIAINLVPALYQTWLLLVVAYTVVFLPRAVVSVRATFEQVPAVFEDAARTLGTSGLQTARRVTLPLLTPGLAASAALVALAVATELTATLLLSPLGTETLATRFWTYASAVEYGAAAPFSVALIALSLPSTWLLSRLAVGDRR